MSASHVSDVPYAHEMQPGDTYEGLSFSVTPEMNQQFLFALEEFDAEYIDASGDGAIVHPVILLHMSARTRSPSFRISDDTGSVFAKDKVTFLAPARVYETLHVSWRVADVYEKRGRVYQAMDTHVINDAGRELLFREAHSVFFVKDKAKGGKGK